jgi:hypothetical protein
MVTWLVVCDSPSADLFCCSENLFHDCADVVVGCDFIPPQPHQRQRPVPGRLIESDEGPFPISWWNALIPAAIATPDAVPLVREPRTFEIIPRSAPNRPAGVVAWPSTLAQAGDIVVCIVDGERFRAFVPKPGHGVAGIADPAPEGTAVTVAVTNDGGVVTARCVAEV